MASVRLDRVWLSTVADHRDVLTFTSRERSDRRSIAGQVRTYANGRTRLISRAGTSTVLGLTAVELTFEQAMWLVEHAGQLMLLRDKPGRRVFGTYLAADISDKRGQLTFDVALDFTELTHNEAV